MKNVLVAVCLALFATAATAGADRALDRAVHAGDLAAAAAAITDGDALDARAAPFLMTPLAVASVRGDLPMVRLLLDAGADPNAPGHRNMNALSAAVRSCRTGLEIIAALIDAGAELEDRAAGFLTPLMAAIEDERTDIALILIAAGADVNALNQFGDGVLNYAIYTRNNSVIRAAMGADVDTRQLSNLFRADAYYDPGFTQARRRTATCGNTG